MRRPCNCKRTTQPNGFEASYVPKLKSYWLEYIGDKSYEELTFDEKQNLNVYFHDIYPLNKSTDGVFIYNKLKKLI